MAGTRSTTIGHFQPLGLLLAGHHLDAAPVDAVREGVLELEDLVDVERLPPFEIDVAGEQIGIEHVLIEAHVAEEVARAGVVVKDDVGPVALEVHPHLALLEFGVQVPLRGRQLRQRLLPLLVGGVEELVPLLDGEVVDDRLEPGIVPPGARQPEVHALDLDGRPGVHLVVGDPLVPLLAQLGAHQGAVVAEGLEGFLDLLRGAGVQAADALLVQLVLVELLQAEHRADVALQLTAYPVDLHLEAEGLERQGEERQADPQREDGVFRLVLHDRLHHQREAAAAAGASTGTVTVTVRSAPGSGTARPSR